MNSRARSRFQHALAVGFGDVVLINIAFYLAWWARYEAEVGPDVAEHNYVTLDAYLPIQLSFTVLLFVIFGLRSAYAWRSRTDLLDQLGTIIGGASLGTAFMIIGVFIWREYALSRLMFSYVWLFSIVLLSSYRIISATIRSRRRRKGIGLDNVVIVGAGQLGRMIMQAIVAEPDSGLRVIGFVDDERDEDMGRFRALGKVDALAAVLGKETVAQVIIALPAASHRTIAAIMMHCAKVGVACQIVPDFYELSLRQVDIGQIGGIPVIGLRQVSIRGWNRAFKRLLDVGLSALVLLVASPLIALIILAIKIDSPGPVLFRQVRLGRNRQPFVINKFRSMGRGAEAEQDCLAALNEVDGPIFKIKNDPRLTRVGWLIRRLSLDELPQFLNVLSGDMSLVGPRPPIPHEVDQYEDWHCQRLEVSPGLTGLWQVSGRSQLTFDEMVLLDIWYIENWSLALDFKILLRTIPAVLFAAGAY